MKSAIIVLLSLFACTRTLHVSTALYVPSDAVATCTTACARLDLRLQSVGLMVKQISCSCAAPTQ